MKYKISEIRGEKAGNLKKKQDDIYLQVTRIGIGALRGGMMTLTPEWRQPRIAPPRASTMKDTKNLQE